ncbi:MAG: helix-turn-helix domain-containing protein [Vicinamibacteria bacterium]
MNSLGSMIESLVADDPRRSADRLLSKMCEIAGAEGGAVLVPQGDNASVFLSYRLSLTGLGSLPIRFLDHRTRLDKGDVVSAPGFALAPVTGEGDAPLAWVYLENPRTAEPKELRPFLLAMAKAVGSFGGDVGVKVPNVNRADANRANILRILEENDWNIARVSRDLGVTRRTLYMRLAAFGIARKKVPRLAKPLTA